MIASLQASGVALKSDQATQKKDHQRRAKLLTRSAQTSRLRIRLVISLNGDVNIGFSRCAISEMHEAKGIFEREYRRNLDDGSSIDFLKINPGTRVADVHVRVVCMQMR